MIHSSKLKNIVQLIKKDLISRYLVVSVVKNFVLKNENIYKLQILKIYIIFYKQSKLMVNKCFFFFKKKNQI